MSIPIETVCADGVKTRFFRFGSGNKTLVIMPGLSVQSVMLFADAIADAYSVFTKDFTVYVFDRRGDPPKKYSVADMAKDAARAFDALGLCDIHLFGASQGGMIALEIAAARPGLIKKAAVASAALRVTDVGSSVIKDWIDKAKALDGEGLYLSFGKAVYPESVYNASRGALSAAGKTVTEYDLRRFTALAGAVEGYDFRPRAKEIKCPLFAAGSRDDAIFGDGFIDEYADAFGGLAGFSYHIYENFGHACYDTAPDFKDRLYRFFTA